MARRRLETVLLMIIAALLLSIACGTVWALVFRDKPAPRAAAQPARAAAPESERVFTGIGRLRLPLAPDNAGRGGTAVLSIAFPYPSNDRPFSEELAARVRGLRDETRALFAALPADDPRLTDEEALKAALLTRYNSRLYLGQIQTLYFVDFMILR